MSIADPNKSLYVGVWTWNAPVMAPNWWPPFIDNLKKQGVAVWLPKILDGQSNYNGSRLQPAVSYASQHGIQTWAWGYERDGRYDNPELEGVKLATRASQLGARAVVVDVEAEWTPKDASIYPFLKAIRLNFERNVYFTTYSSISEHPEFPWEDFIGTTDGFIPQVYQTPVDEWLAKSHTEFRQLAPTGSMDSNPKYRVRKFIPAFYADTTVPYWKPEDTRAGLVAARDAGYGLATLWVSDHMDEAYWALVREFTGGGEVSYRTVAGRNKP